MNRKFRCAVLSLLTVGVLVVETACNRSGVIPTPPPTPMPAPLASITDVLQTSVTGHIAYNAPETMKLDEAVDIQLLLSPIASAEDLQHLIVAQGAVIEKNIEVTPLMKAVLKSDDPQAFVIQSLIQPTEEEVVQVVQTDVPTEWRWSIVAKKAGDKAVTLTIYRQVEYNQQFYWSMVQVYQSKIHISVTPGQWLLNIDWKWLAGIMLTAVLVPAFWRIIDQRKKKKKPVHKTSSK